MAEIYYTTKIPGRTNTVAAWSRAPGYPSLLAVGLSPNSVGVYTEEGRPLDPNKENIIQNVRGSECMKMAWHPLLPMLAIGWKDGAISFWNYEERHLEEDSKTHRSAVTSMLWTPPGDRLITTDENGKLTMWKTDRLMRPIYVIHYDEQPGASIHHCALGPALPLGDDGSQVSTTAYYGVSRDGSTTVKFVGDQGFPPTIVQEFPEGLHSLIYYSQKDQVVVTTQSCNLHVLGRDEEADPNLPWQTISKMKFATGTGEAAQSLQVCWACDHTIASASEKDNVVRLYNFDTEDNYVLQVDANDGTMARIVCLAADNRSGMLAAGTSDGRVTVFKYVDLKDQDPIMDFAKCWEAQPAFQVTDKALRMEWGPNPRLMCVVTASAVSACRKTLLNHRLRDGYVMIQAGVDRMVIESMPQPPPSIGEPAPPLKPPSKLQVPIQILGLDYSKGILMVYDGARCILYKVNDNNEAIEQGGFETSSRAMALQNESIFRVNENRLEVCNTGGTVKQTLSFDELHGSPFLLDICKDFLAAVTTNNYVRVFKVAGREAKPHAGPGLIIPSEYASAGLFIDQIRVNASGSMVSALLSSKDHSREQKMFVYCSETNNVVVYDFEKDHRVPQLMAWDISEPRLLGVQTLAVNRDEQLDLSASLQGGLKGPGFEVATMFVSGEHGVLLQEYQDLDVTGAKGFIGLQAPSLVLNKQSMVNGTGGKQFYSNVHKVSMQGFTGMQDGDDGTKSALLDFSFHMATGNMDEAFRSIKTIKSNTIWENMAHLCIKNKRLDVAEHCLGKMENARGARAAREAKSIEELDARVATVAVHLGMIEDAKKLFASSERHDLLTKLYRASGQWEKALQVAEKSDRIHLKATHYAYAQFLEKTGDIERALEHYKKSGTAFTEVPRMYFEAGQVEALESYIKAEGESKALQTWWARYCESQGDIRKALDCYESAGDYLSMVRIFCFTKDFVKAEEEVMRLNDPAAAFHLARQFEAQERIPEAIRYYSEAKRYSHGVRLAKKYELDAELMNMALKSTPNVMIDAADYLNEKGEHDKAATLYMKGGKLSKAVEMCFSAQLFDVLQHITDDMGPNSIQDPGLYMRCAEFFMQNGHFDKAVKMLIAANNHAHALELCVEHDVPLTEEMAEAMTPPKDMMSNEERNLVLQRIAKIAKRQGSWHLAAKKYTQAGEKMKAMKSLLRSGDSEKIIFFAGVSRQKEIYMMAANFLQTLDWHSDAEIMKSIIQFYTKAQAMDSLASFYQSCAQIEIDEYRDYEKALQAMRESCKYLQKSKSDDRDERLASANARILMAEKFVSARMLITQNPQQALAVCNDVLMMIPNDAQDTDTGIRIGDVYALMIEYWHGQRNHLEAYKLIEQMRGRNIILNPYLDKHMIEDIYRTLGVPMVEDRAAPSQMQSNPAFGDDEGYVDEEVIDEIVDED